MVQSSIHPGWDGIISIRGAGNLVVESTGLIVSKSERETENLGATIGSSCSGGELLRLIGPLGSGKSVLARGVARGLGVSGVVRSPSFNLMREYQGCLTLRHWDLYRLDRGFESLGLLESVEDEAVVLVEWAERWGVLERRASGTIFMDYGDAETVRTIKWEGNVPGLGS
jgi:tRNA threonylcarbamoyladenosine biosynthesis protein TsaE